MSELSSRRNNLFSKMADNSVAIIYSGVGKISSEDENYPFLANRHFFYLTNIEQDNCVLVLVKSFGENKTYLFIDEYNPVKEKWYGKKLTQEEASKIADITNIYTNQSFDSMIDLILGNSKTYGEIKTVYLDLSKELKIGDEKTTKCVVHELKNKYGELEIVDVYPLITKLRMVKSTEEVENIRKAIAITSGGINDLLLNMKVGMYEYSLADRFEFYGRSHERSELSFSTIVAAGKNATILHHPIEQQNDQIEPEDMVLFDLGFAYKGYSADISRTYPILGTFSETQRKVYEAVLAANKSVIKFIKPGLTIKDLQEHAIKILTSECLEKGLISKPEEISKYYYHNVSHHLGLDTHDASFREIPLEAGNVITVEPGLYFKELSIGVRIEDDVLVTDGEAEVLSKDIKKEIADIEKVFKSKATL